MNYENIREQVDSLIRETNPNLKGRGLENLIADILNSVPDLEVYSRNIVNNHESQEIDLAVWNDQTNSFYKPLEHIILFECKNWSTRVPSHAVSYFDRKLENSCRKLGVLVAVNGITGEGISNTAAHDVIINASRRGRMILIVTAVEISRLSNHEDFTRLLKQKYCDLVLEKVTYQE